MKNYIMAFIIIVLLVLILYLVSKDDTKPQPQATLLPTPATHHWVGKPGERRWVEVEEIGGVSNER